MPSLKIKGGNPYVIPLNNHLNDPLAPSNIISTRQMIGGKKTKRKSKKQRKTKKRLCKKCRKMRKSKKMKGGNVDINAYNANPIASFNTVNGASVSSHIIGGVNNHILNKDSMSSIPNETPFI